jgi:CDP-diacylglycerol--serine O-phosphatidyltransferase
MVMLPNGFTLANLFCGIYAIVLASKGDHNHAVTSIVIGAIFDAMDGRVARATGTGSKFGAELDSLVDAISFGLAPALMMYFAVLHKDGWDWILVFLFAACAVMRLARFNVEQAGRAKKYFRGLPSPAAGGVLATYYWFSQTPLYNDTVLAGLPWPLLLRFLMVALSFLMVSNVPYPAWPSFSLRTVRGVIGLLLLIGLAIGLIFLPQQFFFPVGITYVLFGVLAAVLRGLTERSTPDEAPDGAEFDEDVTDEHEVPLAAGSVTTVASSTPEDAPRRRRRRRRRPDGSRSNDRDSSEDSSE